VKENPHQRMADAGFFTSTDCDGRLPPFAAFLLWRGSAPHSLCRVLDRAVSNNPFHIGTGIRVADRPLFVRRDLVGGPVLTNRMRIGKSICSWIAHETLSSSAGKFRTWRRSTRVSEAANVEYKRLETWRVSATIE